MYNLIDIDLAELKPKATNFSISKSNSRILNDKRGNSSTSITKTKKISLNSKSINDLSFDNNVQTNKENIIKIDLNSNLNREKFDENKKINQNLNKNMLNYSHSMRSFSERNDKATAIISMKKPGGVLIPTVRTNLFDEDIQLKNQNTNTSTTSINDNFSTRKKKPLQE